MKLDQLKNGGDFKDKCETLAIPVSVSETTTQILENY